MKLYASAKITMAAIDEIEKGGGNEEAILKAYLVTVTSAVNTLISKGAKSIEVESVESNDKGDSTATFSAEVA